jgi:hypothetical protein
VVDPVAVAVAVAGDVNRPVVNSTRRSW